MRLIDWVPVNVDIDNYVTQDIRLTAELSGRISNVAIGKIIKSDDIWKELNDIVKGITMPTIKKVIFNPPATIIIWNDGSKSVVKAQNGEPYDREKGFALAYLKKLLGNDNTFNKEIHKWMDNDGRI